jgi:FkbM family methyltransferase
LPIKIDPNEAIGHNIACHNIYDLCVTETLWRLTEPGDLTIDVGANIGYTASILGIRVGPTGTVICFEPHPQVFESLRQNVEIWGKDPKCGSFVLHQAALGMKDGQALLHTNELFQTNRGTAWISDAVEHSAGLQVIEVPILNLDRLLGEGVTIGVLKLDAEGHELDILQGMARILKRRGVRDLVFEERSAFPALTHDYLKSLGYSIFGLEESFAGVHCLPETQPSFDPVSGPIPNYLATVDANRATVRLKPAMWQSFGIGRLLPRKF